MPRQRAILRRFFRVETGLAAAGRQYALRPARRVTCAILTSKQPLWLRSVTTSSRWAGTIRSASIKKPVADSSITANGNVHLIGFGSPLGTGPASRIDEICDSHVPHG